MTTNAELLPWSNSFSKGKKRLDCQFFNSAVFFQNKMQIRDDQLGEKLITHSFYFSFIAKNGGLPHFRNQQIF